MLPWRSRWSTSCGGISSPFLAYEPLLPGWLEAGRVQRRRSHQEVVQPLAQRERPPHPLEARLRVGDDRVAGLHAVVDEVVGERVGVAPGVALAVPPDLVGVLG